MEYSTLSKELTQNISKVDKKKDGIYFTPPSCVYNNLKLLQPYLTNIQNVLEPSCGSGEYVTAIHALHPDLNITAIEYNEQVYKSILQLDGNNVKVSNLDYLQYSPNTKYDLIIGNPPYYVMKKKDVGKVYHPYFEGRPNIFILFLVKSFELLNDDGILSFILPKNFMNCLYYDKTRKYIAANFKILYVVECNDKYIETQQDTILLIIRKGVYDNAQFILDKNDYTIFTTPTNHKQLRELYQGSKSLWEFGFKVCVGTVVWNQCKDILTDDNTQTRLIYSSDIVNNEQIMKSYSNKNKKNFINKQGITRPMIVINRGYGVGKYKFNYCLIDEKTDYLVENHLICIESITDLPRDSLITAYNQIILSLNDKRTVEFIKIYFGNNAINTTELNHILPIYYSPLKTGE